MCALIYDNSNPSAPVYKCKLYPNKNTTYYSVEDNPSNPSDVPYTYSTTIYNFSGKIKIEQSGTYNYEAIFYDAYDNEGDTENLGSIEICLVPEPDALSFDTLQFNKSSNLCINGDFNPSGDWVLDNADITDGKLNMPSTLLAVSSAYQTIATELGVSYTITFTVSNFTAPAGAGYVSFENPNVDNITQNGTYTLTYDAQDTSSDISFSTSGNIYFSVDNISIVKTEDLPYYEPNSITPNEGDEYYTIYHYDINTPSTIIEDGKYSIDSPAYVLDIPADGTYSYYRISTGDCSDSVASNNLTVIISGGVVYQLPAYDVSNLYIDKYYNGKLKVRWKYLYNANEVMPDTFFIYYLDNPSGEWVKDGEKIFETNTSKWGQFIYITDANFIHNQEIDIKVVPVIEIGSNDYEKETDDFETQTADSQGPEVDVSNVEITEI